MLLAPAGVSTAAAGGFQYGDRAPNHEGRWLKLAVHSVRLAGNESTAVPFTVAIPARARPGDHFLGIIVLDKRVLGRPAVGHGPIRLHVIPRLAMTVQLQLPGRSTRRLALGTINISVAPSGASLALRISNPANTLIGLTTGRLTVSQGSTPLFGNDIELAAFVPETTITYHLPWSGTPRRGDLSGNRRAAPEPSAPDRV